MIATNRLSGEIPSQIGRYSALSTAFLANGNKLSGPIPTQLGNMEAMTVLFGALFTTAHY